MYADQLRNNIDTRCRRKGRAAYMPKETFGRRLRGLRQDKEWSQIELRDNIKKVTGVEIGETYISELERTEKMPSLEVAAAMAKTLEVTLDYLGFLIDDGSISYKRTQPDVYYSPEADEVARMVDRMSPSERSVIMQVARNLSALTTERARRQAETEDILDSIEREMGIDARREYARILRSKGLYAGGC